MTESEGRKSGFVAIVGRPNAGKSTLLNRVLGSEVSVVTAKAQTTRERVLGIHTEARGQLVFIDTPGIHNAREGGINEYMVEEARRGLEEPTVVWYLVDPRSELEHERAVLSLLKNVRAPIFLLINKIDLVGRSQVTDDRIISLRNTLEGELKEQGATEVRSYRLSGEHGDGTEELMADTWEKIPVGPLHYPDEEQISDRPVRFFVAEKIREQLYKQLGDELPYSCAVEINRFVEPGSEHADAKPGLTRIEATIHVERDSQKGMVVGKGGLKIKQIGSTARVAIEDFVGTKVFLGLKVDVLKDWTRNAEQLRRLGYELPKQKGRKR
jgi:GTPase